MMVKRSRRAGSVILLVVGVVLSIACYANVAMNVAEAMPVAESVMTAATGKPTSPRNDGTGVTRGNGEQASKGTGESDADCLYDGMTVSQAAQCEKRVAEQVRKRHEEEEAAKQAEAQRKAEQEAEQRKAVEEAEQKAQQEEAARQAAAQAEAQRQAEAQAEEQRQAAAQAEAQRQAEAAAQAAAAQAAAIGHAVDRTCTTTQQRGLAACQGAIDLGGLVEITVESPHGPDNPYTTAWLAHNSKGGDWILHTNIGDTVRINGRDYVVTGGWDQDQRKGKYDRKLPRYLLQTCYYNSDYMRELILQPK
ncbi:hypothetical protein EMO89_00460 [Bifidobacterium tissieri]|uniref:Uncharacterized protein n=1 Tax=Bifidobacterium tissieri TaxID=1630162 RepID=A0A5M9ZWP4_9BIFI|nr:hypothetical protein [Bifidobacterium tissieri]KAA8832034.1 hypothetical protein EMO89_00460 [Bifidobacterium tissieri]